MTKQSPPSLIRQEALTPRDQFSPIPRELPEYVPGLLDLVRLQPKHHTPPYPPLYHREPSRIEGLRFRRRRGSRVRRGRILPCGEDRQGTCKAGGQGRLQDKCRALERRLQVPRLHDAAGDHHTGLSSDIFLTTGIEDERSLTGGL